MPRLSRHLPDRGVPAPYQLDARRCMAYLTIEHRRPDSGRAARRHRQSRVRLRRLSGRVPVEQIRRQAQDLKLSLREDLEDLPLAALAALDDAAFRARFAGTPVKRTGRDRFVRNVAIAIGNSGDAALIPAAEALTKDASALVRGAAVWALRQLLDQEGFDRLKREHGPRERDGDVRGEWGPMDKPA